MPGLTRPKGLALIACAPAATSALWLLGGVLLPADDRVQGLSERLDAATPAAPPSSPPSASAGGTALLGRPLFPLAAPTPGSSEAALHLQGLAANGGRSAALVAIGDKPAVWLALGETKDGVTLRRVAREGAVVETMSGDHSLTLGGDHAPPTPSAAPSSPALIPRP